MDRRIDGVPIALIINATPAVEGEDERATDEEVQTAVASTIWCPAR
jgi:hypothetical protein